jgi:hypothetical protein
MYIYIYIVAKVTVNVFYFKIVVNWFCAYE